MNLHSLITGKERVPALERDCVHVWRVFTGMNGGLEGIEESLSEEERARAEQFHFEQDRRSFLVYRGTLRRLISLYTGQNASNIRFEVGSHGKPSLPNTDSDCLRFNISHSGELALLAFSPGAEIGVDVEFKRAGVDFLDLAEYCFSEVERAAVQACSDTERANLFYEYWACKEACIKADGRGLSIPLDEFSVTLVEGAPLWREMIGSESSGLPPGMRSRILDVGDDYAAAVATNVTSWDILQLDLNFIQDQESANELSRGNDINHLAPRRVSNKARSLTATPFSVSERERR